MDGVTNCFIFFCFVVLNDTLSGLWGVVGERAVVQLVICSLLIVTVVFCFVFFEKC